MDWMDVWKEIKNMGMKHNESVKTSLGVFSPTSAGLAAIFENDLGKKEAFT